MGDSQTVWIEGPAGKLESAFREAPSPRALAVIAHPHPLYGGTMHNPVVFHVDRELNLAGLATLRFNFRGVGGSEGFHDEGRGEVGDVGGAAAWIRRRVPGTPLVLVGYSFGSRCSVGYALDDASVAAVVAVGLPVRVWRFDELSHLACPFVVVQGSRDEFGSPDEIRPYLEAMRPAGRIVVIDGAEHLFTGRAPEAAARVVEAVEACLA